MKNSVINFTALCGVVLEKKKTWFWLDYGKGKIKVYAEGEILDSIDANYTLTVSGQIGMKWLRTYLDCTQCTILDKKPHYLQKGD